MSILKYDVDCTTWSPQGKLLQVDYAKEAVKQGSICLALRSPAGAVLLSVKKNPSKLACYQEKVFRVSRGVGVGLAGMTGDGRHLVHFMQTRNAQRRMKYNSDATAHHLAKKVASKMHARTVTYGRRPFGVGLLVVGRSDDAFSVYELAPSGECVEYEAFAIGAKSQSAKTYLEKNLQQFHHASVEQLVLHGLTAIRAGYRDEKEQMSEKNVEVAFVSRENEFQSLTPTQIAEYIARLDSLHPTGGMVIE